MPVFVQPERSCTPVPALLSPNPVLASCPTGSLTSIHVVVLLPAHSGESWVFLFCSDVGRPPQLIRSQAQQGLASPQSLAHIQ